MGDLGFDQVTFGEAASLGGRLLFELGPIIWIRLILHVESAVGDRPHPASGTVSSATAP